MFDLIDLVSHDYEGERVATAIHVASTAAFEGDSWGVLAGSISRDDFENRLALLAPTLDATVERATQGDAGLFLQTRAVVVDRLTERFEALHRQRQAETQERNARRAARRTAEREIQRRAQEAKTAATIGPAAVEVMRQMISPLDTPETRGVYERGEYPRPAQDVDKRYRWDLFWAAGGWKVLEQAGLNGDDLLDSHIDTALRSIVPKLGSRRAAARKTAAGENIDDSIDLVTHNKSHNNGNRPESCPYCWPAKKSGSRKTANLISNDINDYIASPPESWVVEKAGDRLWHLKLKAGDENPIASYETRTRAEEDRSPGGYYFKMYHDDLNWMNGDNSKGYAPYSGPALREGRRKTASPRAVGGQPLKVGDALVGFPGSKVLDIFPNEALAMDGPKAYELRDGKPWVASMLVEVQLEDGRVVVIPYATDDSKGIDAYNRGSINWARVSRKTAGESTISDYGHWNEEAPIIWAQENNDPYEGEYDNDPYDDYDDGDEFDSRESRRKTAGPDSWVNDGEWHTSYLTGGGQDGVRLNVYKSVDEPNEWGGIGVSVRHPDHDGKTFPSIEDAQAYAAEHGLIVRFGDTDIGRQYYRDRAQDEIRRDYGTPGLIGRRKQAAERRRDGYDDRYYMWIGPDGSEYHAAGSDDNGPAHRGYNSSCSWCWLGASHTEQAHAAALASGGGNDDVTGPQGIVARRKTARFGIQQLMTPGRGMQWYIIDSETLNEDGEPVDIAGPYPHRDMAWYDAARWEANPALAPGSSWNGNDWTGLIGSRKTASMVMPADFESGKSYRVTYGGDAGVVTVESVRSSDRAVYVYGSVAWSDGSNTEASSEPSIVFGLSDGPFAEVGSRQASRKTAYGSWDDVKVGSIFVSQWGYDQTNTDFYEVTRMSEASIWLRKIAKTVVTSGGAGGDKVMPLPGQFVGDEFRRKLDRNSGFSGPWISINSYAGASLWDGTPQYETNPMWGH